MVFKHCVLHFNIHSNPLEILSCISKKCPAQKNHTLRIKDVDRVWVKLCARANLHQLIETVKFPGICDPIVKDGNHLKFKLHKLTIT